MKTPPPLDPLTFDRKLKDEKLIMEMVAIVESEAFTILITEATKLFKHKHNTQHSIHHLQQYNVNAQVAINEFTSLISRTAFSLKYPISLEEGSEYNFAE